MSSPPVPAASPRPRQRRKEARPAELTAAALRLFVEAGCAEVSVSTGEANDPAQHVYREAGLTETSLLLEKHFG